MFDFSFSLFLKIFLDKENKRYIPVAIPLPKSLLEELEKYQSVTSVEADKRIKEIEEQIAEMKDEEDLDDEIRK